MTKSIEHSDRPLDNRPRPDAKRPLLTNTYYKDGDVAQFLVTVRSASRNDVGLIRKAIIGAAYDHNIDIAVAGHAPIAPDNPFYAKRG